MRTRHLLATAALGGGVAIMLAHALGAVRFWRAPPPCAPSTRVMLELVGRGERVFITCGASHMIRDEPVLRAELAGFIVSGPL